MKWRSGVGGGEKSPLLGELGQQGALQRASSLSCFAFRAINILMLLVTNERGKRQSSATHGLIPCICAEKRTEM